MSQAQMMYDVLMPTLLAVDAAPILYSPAEKLLPCLLPCQMTIHPLRYLVLAWR
jgi:hypothetical protein